MDQDMEDTEPDAQGSDPFDNLQDSDTTTLGESTEELPQPETEPMDPGRDEPMEPEAARASTSTGGSNPQSKETLISRYPTLTYGLQETHTTILPYTTWFSVVGTKKSAGLQYAARLNSIWDMVPNTIQNIAAGSTHAPAARGFFNRPVGSGLTVTTNAAFPHEYGKEINI